MKAKQLTLFILLGTIFLIVFNVCFFLLTNQSDLFPDGRITTTWINYGCIHAAYILLLLTPLLLPRVAQKDAEMTVYTLNLSFWWFELVLSSVLIFYAIPLVYNVIIQVICWGYALTRLFILMLVNNDTAEKQQRHNNELLYVKTAESLLKTMLNSIDDKATYRQVEKVYDFVRTSPVKSATIVQPTEAKVLQLVQSLVITTDSAEITKLCSEILLLAQQRNQQLLINNKSL